MPTILFLSECCLLDRKSGAAQSVRAQLQVLSQVDWQCHTATMTLCDGEAEYPLAEHDTRLNGELYAASQVELDDSLVNHQLYVTRSTRHSQLRPWELRAYLAMAEQVLTQVQPDVVLTYSSAALQPLLALAQQRGARTAFYLANSNYAQREGFAFHSIDEFLVPSQAMADLYQNKMQLACTVLRDLVNMSFDGAINLEPARITSRGERSIVMINPEPAKGGLFFLNLANQAATAAPQLKFCAVESRWGRESWANKGVPENTLNKVDWYPHSYDLTSLFKQTALLLVPSLRFEASARVIAEALLAGIPVIAMDSGGIKEQLNGGGFVFSVPKAMQTNYLAPPESVDLQQWLQFIKVLMADGALYNRAVKLALQAASVHKPDLANAAAVALFSDIAAKPALINLHVDEVVKQQLVELRVSLNQEREALNAQLALQPLSDEALHKPLNKSLINNLTDISDEALHKPLNKSLINNLTDISGSLNNAQSEPYAGLLQRSLRQPAIREALVSAKAGDYEQARSILEQYLRILPEDILALGLLADVAHKQQKKYEACRLMSRAIALAPGFLQGQHQLLGYLAELGDAKTATLHTFELLERAPHQPRYLALHAGFLTQAHRFEEAVSVYAAYFKNNQGIAKDYMYYALALKTLGQQQPAVDAYRNAIMLAPGSGNAWHGLSNMKLAVFTTADTELMGQQLTHETLSAEDRYNIHFTLGKAHEDNKVYSQSFEHYAQANQIRHSQTDYDIGQLENYVAEAKKTFTREFFEARQGHGNMAADPIFIIGLHRAGSTLTEQILSSHSQVEGTRELPDLLRMGRDFVNTGTKNSPKGINTTLLAALTSSEWQQLGQDYIESTRVERHTKRPLFIDKMPANWMHAGLIQLMLPNARIIDVRRKPMAAGFALFKMNFGKGVEHAYSQSDIARYYLAYTDLMAHFDVVLPKRIYHLQYENLVANTDDEITALLNYCDIPFESQCLQFWQTDRAVQTPSSEQVRQPIYQHASDQWSHYAPWLGEMQTIFDQDQACL